MLSIFLVKSFITELASRESLQQLYLGVKVHRYLYLELLSSSNHPAMSFVWREGIFSFIFYMALAI